MHYTDYEKRVILCVQSVKKNWTLASIYRKDMLPLRTENINRASYMTYRMAYLLLTFLGFKVIYFSQVNIIQTGAFYIV